MDRLAKGGFTALDVAASVAAAAAGAVVSAGNAAGAGLGKALASEAQFFDETVTPERIKHLLDNVEAGSGKASIMEKVEGMKYILASMARGRDASEFYPDVVRNVIVKSVEVKKLVYSYLQAYADANATCRELALLSINSFQRDLSDPNQLIRSMALRVLTSIRMREIVQIQLMSLKKCASDSSPYVRKTAAHACGKIYQIDTDAKGEIVEVIERLLGDKNTQVLSSAVAAFDEVCPDQLELLHPHYRKLCHLLADLDDWGQITAMSVLTRYARTYFAQPALGADDEKEKKGKGGGKDKGKGKGKKEFYSDSESSDSDSSSESSSSSEEEDEEDDGAGPKLAEDHATLLRVAAPLLRSRNSGVVLAVASLYHYVGAGEAGSLAKIGRSLVRVMRNHREIQYIVLTNIVTFARVSPGMFRAYLKDFFVAESEPTFVRRMKVDVLAALVDGENATAILREFTRYVKDDDKEFVRHAIQAIVRIANTLPEIADRCLRGLMGLVGTTSDVVVAEAVVAIRQLLQQHPQHDALIVRLAGKLDKIASPSARAAIVWIIGEFQGKPRVAALAPDALRQLAKNFKTESPDVKAQIVNLAAKTSLLQPDSRPVRLLLHYVLDLARYDSDYDLRDRARLLRYLVLGTEVTQLAAEATEEAGAVIAVKGRDTADGDQLASELPPLTLPEGAAAGGSSAAEGEEGAAAAAAASEGAAGGAEGEAAGASDGAAAATPVRASSPSAGSPTAGPPTPMFTAAGSPAASGVTARLQDRVAAVLLAAKPPPLIQNAIETGGSGGFSMGSLSFVVGHAAKGYNGVPGWAPENSSPKLRDPPKEDEGKAKKKKGAAGKKGRADSSSDDSTDSDSDSSDDDSSDSDSATSASSDSEASDEEESDDESSSEEEEEEEEESESEEESEEESSEEESDEDSD